GGGHADRAGGPSRDGDGGSVAPAIPAPSGAGYGGGVHRGASGGCVCRGAVRQRTVDSGGDARGAGRGGWPRRGRRLPGSRAPGRVWAGECGRAGGESDRERGGGALAWLTEREVGAANAD